MLVDLSDGTDQALLIQRRIVGAVEFFELRFQIGETRFEAAPEPVRAVIEKGPASVIKVPPPEATYLAAGWALPASGHDAASDGSCRNVGPPVVGPRRDVGWAVPTPEASGSHQ